VGTKRAEGKEEMIKLNILIPDWPGLCKKLNALSLKLFEIKEMVEGSKVK